MIYQLLSFRKVTRISLILFRGDSNIKIMMVLRYNLSKNEDIAVYFKKYVFLLPFPLSLNKCLGWMEYEMLRDGE